MEAVEKQALRTEKLNDLYNHNDQTGGREKHIRYMDLYSNEQEKQEHLAYEYLADKGLIHYKILAANYYTAKITSYGIDLAEE